MSLVVPCPGCPAKLSTPESAAGKQIRCPKCKAVVTVPALIAAEEVAVVDAKIAPPRSQPAVADDDEEEDTEDTRPRNKKKRPRTPDDEPPPPRRKRRKAAGAAKSGSGGVILLVFAALLLLGGLATGAFLLARRGTPTADGASTDSPLGDFANRTLGSGAGRSLGENLLPAPEPPAPAPAGWKQYSYPDAGFKAYFPSQPLVSQTSGTSTGPSGFQTSRTGWELFSGGGSGADEGATVKFWVIRFSHGAPHKLSDQLDYVARRRAPGLNPRRVRWLGHDASEVELAATVVRVTSFGDTLIAAQVIGPRGLRARPDELAGFFTNVELTK